MQLKESLVEAIIGAVVVLVAALFLVYAYSNTAMGRSSSCCSSGETALGSVGLGVETAGTRE